MKLLKRFNPVKGVSKLNKQRLNKLQKILAYSEEILTAIEKAEDRQDKLIAIDTILHRMLTKPRRKLNMAGYPLSCY